MRQLLHYFVLSWIFFSNITLAMDTFSLPKGDDNVIGYLKEIHFEPGDSLAKIAYRYGVGYEALLRANPQIVPEHVYPWSRVYIPSAYILPPGPRKGIVINISEMRLYYYPNNENKVLTAPVSIGRQGWETPIAKTTIIDKQKDPQWRPPESIKQYTAKHGFILPDVVPAGPDNPLGEYAFRLGLNTYLIHGTDDPYSIGKRISSGCIRMYPQDIEKLFEQVPIGTPVNIINEPYKVGWLGNRLYFEAHPPIENKPMGKVVNRNYKDTIMTRNPNLTLDWKHIAAIAKEENGYPARIN